MARIADLHDSWMQDPEYRSAYESVAIEFDPETNTYSAVCPGLSGCALAGDTAEEARANLKEAIELYLEAPPTSPSPPE